MTGLIPSGTCNRLNSHCHECTSSVLRFWSLQAAKMFRQCPSSRAPFLVRKPGFGRALITGIGQETGMFDNVIRGDPDHSPQTSE